MVEKYVKMVQIRDLRREIAISKEENEVYLGYEGRWKKHSEGAAGNSGVEGTRKQEKSARKVCSE
jgi:hypothetical protein